MKDGREGCLTYSIEEVARKLGVGRNQAYEGARRGDFPTIRVGKRILAPKQPIDRMLAGDRAA
jgi:excisionase family DNA binding protein